jgi:threonylcarbamoyladenosine tRNA methylthiotransferase MtaB
MNTRDGMEIRQVSVSTLGCKSNQYDSSALEDILKGEGRLDIVPFPGPADAYIINTCTVTGRTDSQSRQLIRKVRRINPDAIVIVTGCYAQVSPQEVSRIEGVDYVLGNPQKAEVLEYLRMGRQKSAKTVVGDYRKGTPLTLKARGSAGRTRANLKIQEGCNRSCSYCIIPMARGASKSVTLEGVEREIDALVQAGFKEIVLTGIHLGAWGADLGISSGITSVLELIEKQGYPCRFRLSSLDPDEVTDGLIDVLKSSKRVCNHLHLPLQSGDDTVIRRMKRPYTGALFAQKVLRLVEEVQEISVGVDVIAGFPGENEKEFENTFSLLNDLPLSYLHIFPFSKRRGTAAAGLDGHVLPAVINGRCARLKELDTLKREKFFGGFTGRKAEVLVESSRDKATGSLKGRARNYIPVVFEGKDALKGTLAEVVLERFTSERMSGMISG